MTQTVTVTQVEVTKAGKTDRIVLHYTNNKGEPRKIGALAVKLDSESRTKVLAAKSGDTLAIDMAKEGEYWNLTKVAEATSVSSTTTTSTAKTKSTYDDTGVKVGASRNQAVAFLAATRGSNFTLDDVDKTAYEIVQRQADQESHVRAGTRPEDLSSLETEKQYAQASLDDIDF